MDSVFDVIAMIERSRDLDAIKAAVREIANGYGYDRIVMFAFSSKTHELLEGIYWAEGHWFSDGEALDTETYVRHCPVTRHVLETDQPFFWTKVSTHKGKQFRFGFGASPRGQGLHGIQVPVFGHNGLKGAVCFGGEHIDSNPKTRLILTQVGITSFFAVRHLLESPKPVRDLKLSKREREVLEWIASGKRNTDIAGALGLSERTVENHLRRVRHRLQVKTTAQAVGAFIRSDPAHTQD